MKIKTKKAFSLVELSLATAFLGMMILGIATLTVRIMKIYQKGLAIKNVNNVGREVIDDIRKHVESSRKTIGINIPCNVTSGCNFSLNDVKEQLGNIYIAKMAHYDAGTEDVVGGVKQGYQASGAFCTSDYTYIWNTGQSIRYLRDNKTTPDLVSRQIIGDSAETAPRLARVNGNYCESAKTKNGVQLWQEISAAGESTDVISRNDGGSDVAIYDLSLVSATQNEYTNEIIYTFSMTLGTVDGGVDIMSNGDYCTGKNREFYGAQAKESVGMQYCAINKFEFTAIQKGEVSL